MFTGIIECTGSVQRLLSQPPGVRLEVGSAQLSRDASLGDSVAVNGCCLTVVGTGDDTLQFDAGSETLSRTNLGELAAGSTVNLERSLQVGDLLGGHFVTGHVDVVGTLQSRHDDSEWSTFWFEMPTHLSAQMVEKGSIAVDGISLTLVDVQSGRFSVALIPHTLRHTTLGKLRPGDRVNLETDILAKYVQKQLRPPES